MGGQGTCRDAGTHPGRGDALVCKQASAEFLLRQPQLQGNEGQASPTPPLPPKKTAVYRLWLSFAFRLWPLPLPRSEFMGNRYILDFPFVHTFKLPEKNFLNADA